MEDALVSIVLKMFDDRWAMYDKFSDKGAHFVERKMHRYGADGHVHKTQRMVRKSHNFNSQLLRS
jgi:hypothetical protein